MALSAQDNAYAERINRTIKEEYLDHWKPTNFSQLKKHVAKAVLNYNNQRLHNHLPGMSPVTFEKNYFNNNLVNKKGLTIFDNNKKLT